MLENAKWIQTGADIGNVSPEFKKCIKLRGKVRRAIAEVSAMGVYDLLVDELSPPRTVSDLRYYRSYD